MARYYSKRAKARLGKGRKDYREWAKCADRMVRVGGAWLPVRETGARRDYLYLPDDGHDVAPDLNYALPA